MALKDVHQAAKDVADAQSFISFLDILRADWDTACAAEKTNPSAPYSSMHGWENTTIGDFLEAAAAGATDFKIGQPQGSNPDDNPWTQAAQILFLGKLYE